MDGPRRLNPDTIQSDILAIENHSFIREESRFVERFEAIDYLESDVMDWIEALSRNPQGPSRSLESREDPAYLRQQAQRIIDLLEGIDEALFRRLRAEIREAGWKGQSFKQLVDNHVDPEAYRGGREGTAGYDCLDTFINGLLHSQPPPAETRAREPGMVWFQKTPARIVFEMVEKARFTDADVFYDIGSGMGQVAILAHLLSGVAARGIEFEPAFCEHARASAADLDLPDVEFLQADAREADYSQGTVCFMYTPFEGPMLDEVLDKMRREAKPGFRLFTYGPCTPQVGRQVWLKSVGRTGRDIHSLGAFERISWL